MSFSLPPFGGAEPVGLRRGRDLPPRRAAGTTRAWPAASSAPPATGARAVSGTANAHATDVGGASAGHEAEIPPVQQRRRTSFAFTPGRWLGHLRGAVWAVVLAPARLAAALSALLEACLAWLARAANYVVRQPDTWEAEARQTPPPTAAATPVGPVTPPPTAPAAAFAARASASTAATAAPPPPAFVPAATPASSATPSADASPESTPYASPTPSPPPSPPRRMTMAPTPEPAAAPGPAPTARGEATLRALAAAAAATTSPIAALDDDQLADVVCWLRAQLGPSRAQRPHADYSLGGRAARGLSAALRARPDFRPTTQGYWRGLRRPQGGWGDGQVSVAPVRPHLTDGAVVHLVDVDAPESSLGRRLLLRVRFARGTNARTPGLDGPRPAVPRAWLQAYARALGNVVGATQARREAEVYGAAAMAARLATAGPPMGAVRVPPELVALRRELRAQLNARGDAAVRVGEECVVELG